MCNSDNIHIYLMVDGLRAEDTGRDIDVFQDVAAASSHHYKVDFCLQNESTFTKDEANIRSLFNTFVITTSTVILCF